MMARLDRCVQPHGEANHPPIVRIAGPSFQAVRPGETITPDASRSSDPDGNRLSFAWSIYPPDPDLTDKASLHACTSTRPQVEVSPAAAGKLLSLLLAVTDDGSPPLTRYGRTLLQVGPAD